MKIMKLNSSQPDGIPETKFKTASAPLRAATRKSSLGKANSAMDRKFRRIILQFSGQMDRLLADKPVLGFSIAFAVLCINYRIWLSSSLLFGHSAPPGFEHGNVFAYNLAKDPDEKIPLAYDRFTPHLDAILKFRNY